MAGAEIVESATRLQPAAQRADERARRFLDIVSAAVSVISITTNRRFPAGCACFEVRARSRPVGRQSRKC
jgi:hypothetical protein